MSPSATLRAPLSGNVKLIACNSLLIGLWIGLPHQRGGVGREANAGRSEFSMTFRAMPSVMFDHFHQST